MRLLIAFVSAIAAGCASSKPPGTVLDAPEEAPDSRPGTKLAAWEEALHWLPENTETLVVAQEPFALELASKEDRNDGAAGEGTIAETCRPLAYLSLALIREARWIRRLGVWRIAAAVHGSRNFRLPTGLGMLPYEGADILFMEDPKALDPLMKEVETETKERVDVAGRWVP